MNEDSEATIYVDGSPYKVPKGIPLGAALYKLGIYAFERSMRFSRPRGLMVFSWRGPEKINILNDFEENPYLLKTDDGIKISTNVKPPLPRTLLNLFKSYLKVGGYNKWPFNRMWAWNLALKYIEDILPWNQPRGDIKTIDSYPKKINISADVIVVGGGFSGLEAAYSVSKSRYKVVVVEADELGGHLTLYGDSKYNSGYLNNLVKRLEENNVHIVRNTVFQGFFEDAAVGYNLNTNQLIVFSYKTIIFANGSYEIPALYENNDLPKNLLASASLKLYFKYGVEPGKKIVVIGSTDRALKAAIKFAKEGFKVILIEGFYRGFKYDELVKEAKEVGVTIYEKVNRVVADGKERVERVRIRRDGEWINIDADAVLNAPYIVPDIELARMARIGTVFDIELGGYIPIHNISGETTVENIFIAGSVGGVGVEEIYVKMAKLAGYKVSEYLGSTLDDDFDNTLNEVNELLNKYPRLKSAYNRLEKAFREGSTYEYYNGLIPTLYPYSDYSKVFLCFCTDVTLEDLKKVVKEDKLDIMEHIKRYSGAATGRCQGRRCFLNTLLSASKFSLKSPSEVGVIRSRPPYIPMPLYIFGGE